MSARARGLATAVRAAALATLVVLTACSRAPEPGTAANAASENTAASAALASAERIEHGRRLAGMGHCAGCHSLPDEPPYSGGRALPTPFGTVYGGNLTPDPEHGLGRWTADDFWRALHQGRSRDGRALVPAFPYTSYTHITRADSDALFDYLRSLPPAAKPSRSHALRFPYGSPLALSVWQWLFFEPADPAASARASRGAYLVDGLGHCAACHAPRNAWGAPGPQSTGAAMPGQGWYAPSLHPPPAGSPAGTARTEDEILALLRDGQTARDTVLGPMAEVVRHSTQYWPEADLRAVARHLASLPPGPGGTGGSGGAERRGPQVDAAQALRDQGARLYADRCADCHGAQGQGVPGAYPALAGNATVQHPDARNLAQVVRLGGFPPTTAAHPRPYGMPPQRLSDAELAALLTYLRQSWGHRAGPVTPLEILQWR